MLGESKAGPEAASEALRKERGEAVDSLRMGGCVAPGSALQAQTTRRAEREHDPLSILGGGGGLPIRGCGLLVCSQAAHLEGKAPFWPETPQSLSPLTIWWSEAPLREQRGPQPLRGALQPPTLIGSHLPP